MLSIMRHGFVRFLVLFLALALIELVLAWYGWWIPNRRLTTQYPIRGIDVSHHQHDIDWQKVGSSGVGFAYIKATEGADYRDPKFADNWRGAQSAGIPRGAYHFFTLGTAGARQAENFIATVPIDPAALPPAIDLEFSGYNKGPTQSLPDFQRELSAFWDAIVAHYGKIPVVYTATDFQKHYLAAMPIERLWIREIITRPRQPWMFWQFSPRGRVQGISTFVDLNVFRGSAEEFTALQK